MTTSNPLTHVHRLELPTPFHVGTVNAYLVEGEVLTLFDCGLKTTECYETLEEKVKGLGYQIADIEQVIISHHHTDHLGLVGRVLEESGARILSHRYAVPFLERPSVPRKHHEEYFQIICHESGVPDEISQVFRFSYQWIEQFSNPPVKVDLALDEGDVIRAGDRDWHVYYTPGHAGDLICLFEPESRVLWANDHLILKISSNPLVEPPPEAHLPRPHRLVEYIYHMQRMADLNPVIALSGHGNPIEDVQGLVSQRIAFHKKRAHRILEYFDEPHNLWQITQKLFNHIPDPEKFLALSEVLGHIDILEEEGQLQRDYQNGVVFWNGVGALHQAPLY
jgi:glyoxylase-like metal-dependent hydrolase (beta-lactamase superfamily II)